MDPFFGLVKGVFARVEFDPFDVSLSLTKAALGRALPRVPACFALPEPAHNHSAIGPVHIDQAADGSFEITNCTI